MMPSLPETRYAKSGDVHIAYQVIGDGPLDLVVVPGWVSHLEYQWEDPWGARFFERLASFSRLIRFDKRGTGLSDRVSEMPTLEQRMDDVRAVMDAIGSERAALFSFSEGGPMSILFAAAYPQRTTALSLWVVCEVCLGPVLSARPLGGAAACVLGNPRTRVGWTRRDRVVCRQRGEG
jgi:pimeloyl-ACP methyl ester carboxylesterase